MIPAREALEGEVSVGSYFIEEEQLTVESIP